jgi:lysophospholipase L1-like esterase
MSPTFDSLPSPLDSSTTEGLSPARKFAFLGVLYVLMALIGIGAYFLLQHWKAQSAGDFGAKLRAETDPYKKATFMVPVPYTGFHCYPNIRSPIINTNDLGLRGTLDFLEMVSAAHRLKSQGYKIGIFAGGSAAFGYFSSTDAKSIPGLLTAFAEAQARKICIFNFGMSSYTSDQELVSLVMYASALNPDILIVMNGHNDILHAIYEAPSGNPGEPYNIGAGIDYGFPRIREMYAAHTGLKYASKYLDRIYEVRDDSPAIPEGALNETLENYRKNLSAMARFMKASGGKVIFAPQPVLRAHNRLTTPPEDAPYLKKLHRVYDRLVGIAQDTAREEQQTFVDIVTVFENLDPATKVFVDKVHLNDEGQQLVAMKLWPVIARALSGDH